MLMHDVLLRSAARDATAVALRSGGEAITYGRVASDAARVAAWLGDRGLRPGDRVITLFDKSIGNVAALFGTWWAGGVAVNLHPRMPPETVARIIDDCEPRAVLGSSALIGPAMGACTSGRHVPPVIALLDDDDAAETIAGVERPAWRDGAVPDAPRPDRINLDLAAIIYTSGSTGRQKGVMLSHLNLTEHIHSITSYLENTADDRLISVLPLSFGYGLSQLITAASVGASLSLVPSGAFPNDIADVLERNRITGMAGVPSHFRMLLDQAGLASRELPALRYITISGSKSPEFLVRDLRSALPHVRIFLMYGQTESTIRISFLDPGEIDRRPTSVGRPIRNVRVFLLDDEGRDVSGDPPGSVGEIVCHGTNVMIGYWGDPALTATVLRPHPELVPSGASLLHTGDLGRLDEDGYLHLAGRRDEMIKSGGNRIFPMEIESVLLAVPGVREAAVVAEADETLGDVVVAHVVMEDGTAAGNPRPILRHCRRHLASYMVPRRVYFHTSLPRTSTGKILRAEVRRITAARMGSPAS